MQLKGDSVIAEITGTKYGVAEVAEQFLWLSSALRQTNEEAAISLNQGDLYVQHIVINDEDRSKYAVNGSRFVGTLHVKAQYESRPVKPNDASKTVVTAKHGECWRAMFGTAHIVAGYPIPSRKPRTPGLEISFELMTTLVRAERITPIGSALLLKGFSELLYTSQLVGNIAYWHMISNISKEAAPRTLDPAPDHAYWIEYTDKRVTPIDDSVLDIVPSRLLEAGYLRHVVGWDADIRSLIGTNFIMND